MKMRAFLAGFLILFPSLSHARLGLLLGPKVPVGFHFLYPPSGGWQNTIVQTGLGIGGSIEGKLFILGLNIDLLYQQDGTWGRKKIKNDTFRLPINLRVHVPGFFIEGGPEFIMNGGNYFVLDLGFGTSISLRAISLIFETPKIAVNWWDKNVERYEILFSASFMLKVF